MDAETSQEAQIRRIWERDAPRYDGWMRQYDRFMVRDGRAWICAQATGKVLEVAVGTGLNLPHYPAGTQVTGIDLSAAMLEQARPRAAASPATVTLQEASATALPFPDASFDTVVCVLALCCIPDDQATVEEMHRVLRPAGHLLLLDHIPSTSFPVRIAQRAIEPLLVRFSGDYQMRRPLRVVEKAGFTVVRRERYRLGMIERLAAVKEPHRPDQAM